MRIRLSSLLSLFLVLFVFSGAASAHTTHPSEGYSADPSLRLAPVANDDTYIVYEGTTLTISAPGVLENDTGATEVFVLTAPAHGTLTLNADGSFTYEHDGLSTEDDSFTYTATDGVDSATGTVTLDVLPIGFGVSSLEGHSLNKPTSLDFGPDSVLYVLRKLGHVNMMRVQRNGANDYSVVSEEVTILPRQIPNYDDDGTYNDDEKNRQATGIVAAGTPSNPVLYISSSDARVGGNGGATDTGLDTNSGVISKLSWIGTSRTDPGGYWERIDLVRGIPRSEENHANNGMVLSVTGDTLFVTVGGFTNAGAPSNNFAFITEYALSSTVIAIDLAAIEAMPTQVDAQGASYKYNLPTLDDPTRANVNGIYDINDPNYDGIDVNDPWGGNDGLNQAKFIPGSPVIVHASGFRNPYDLVLSESGKMYVVDNGPNPGWGGHPLLEGPQGTCTNDYDPAEPGSGTPGPNDPQVNNMDNLHYVRELAPGERYYAGHPTPVRGNPAGAGLYTGDYGTDGVWRDGSDPNNPLPADWPPVPVSEAYPVECDYRNPGETDGAISTFGVSTNGLTEYTASNFNGAFKGDLFAAGYNNNTIYHVDLNDEGDQVLNNHPNGQGTGVFAENFGSIALDVIAQGDNDPFPGTLWVVDLDVYDIFVFEPNDYEGGTVTECVGNSDPGLDEDNDGYDNEDEILNGTNACSAASKPADADNDLTSDLLDPDDDNDGVSDIVDAFQIDADNGASLNLPVDYPLLNEDPGTGFFGLGFTGVMVNGTEDYLDLYDFDELIPGGTAGLFTITNVSEGNAFEGDNTHRNGFQVGINVGSSTGPYTARVRTLSPFFNGLTPENDQSQGFYLGTGDQDNYVAIMLHAQDGSGGIRIIHEEGGTALSIVDYVATGILDVVNLDLFLSVDPVEGTIQPKYVADGGVAIHIGLPLQVSGDLLAVIQGAYEVQPGTPSMLALGLMSTSDGSGPVFNATWDHIEVNEDPIVLEDEWITLQAPTNPKQRHENAFVESGGKYYLIGGRGSRRTFEYDPVANTWTQLSLPPLEFHHFQAVSLENTVYVIGAYVGSFPDETPVPEIYTYTPATDTWAQGSTIPVDRQRGAAGAVVYNGKIYMVAGSIGGHGSEATFPLMLDEYDPQTDTWTQLPDAPRGRDHFHATVAGDKLYVLGGRAGSVGATIAEVDVFDFATNTWSTLPSPSGDVPTPRGGSTTATMGNEIFFLGGESGAQTLAHSEVEVLDTETNSWRSLSGLNTGRHGTQAIVDGTKVFIAAGAGETGGGPELTSLEVFERTDISDPGTVIPSTLAASLSLHDFGQLNLGFSSSQTISLTNTNGNQNIEVTAITLSGEAAFSESFSESLPHTLLPGESLDIDVSYTPTEVGLHSGSLDVTHDGENGPLAIALNGEGVEGVLSDDPIFRVNAGGGAIPDGVLTWDRDTKNKPSAHINTGTGDNKTNREGVLSGENLTGAPDELFETSRWDPAGSEEMMWNFPVSASSLYDIRLFFRESSTNNHVIGGRIFDVLIEGETVLNDFDIYAEAGENDAIVKTFQVYVEDGNIDIDFIRVVDNPVVNGIQISPVTAGLDLIASAETLDFFTVEVGSTSELQDLTLTNTSQAGIDVTSVSIDGEHADDFSHTFSSQTSIPAGESFSFSLDFTPSSSGDRSASLTINHTGESSPLVIALEGAGSEAHLSFLELLVIGSGTITKTPDEPLYNDGTVVTLEAIPDPGWEFVEWTGSAFGVDNPIDVTIAGDMVVTAVFLESTATVDPIYRVNAGGGAESDTPIVWDRDTKNKPSAYVNADTGDNKVGREGLTGVNATSAPSGVFDRYRWDPSGNGEMEWDFPVESTGSYVVNLFFAETKNSNTGIGDRVFDVVLEGDLVLDDYDIVADVGFQTATSKSFTVEVTDGNIDIDFIHVEGDPMISAIEVMPTPATMPIAMRKKNEASALFATKKPVRFYEQHSDGGWMLMGRPLDVGADLKLVLDDNSLQFLGYADGDYTSLETTREANAFWLRSSEEKIYSYSGYEIDSLVVNLRPGWNMIAGPSCDIMLASMRGYEHIVPGTVYRFDKGYFPAQRIEQGRGYWAYAEKAGQLELNCDERAITFRNGLEDGEELTGTFGELLVRDASGASRQLLFGASMAGDKGITRYALPPKAPGAAFDVRFVNDSKLIKESMGRIELSGEAPFEIDMVNIPESLGKEYVVSVLRQNAEIDLLHVKAGDSVVLAENADAIVIQSVEDWEVQLPEVFSLQGNYPNPFNPQTSIIFDMPERGDIEIDVYDVIGRRVMTLHQEAVEAGRRRTIQIDARDLASGVYLYQIKALMNGVTARESGKMTLVK